MSAFTVDVDVDVDVDRERLPNGEFRDAHERHATAGARIVEALDVLRERAKDRFFTLGATELQLKAAAKDEEKFRRASIAIESCAVKGIRQIMHFACKSDGCRQAAKTVPIGCGKRICPACVGRHRARTEKYVRAALQRFQRALLVTLTIRSGFDLQERLDFLAASFTRFTRRRWWTERVDNWIACIEVTWDEQTGWHPHMHIAVDAQFLPWSRREAWERRHGRLQEKDRWSSWFFGDLLTLAEICEERRRNLKREVRAARRSSSSTRKEEEELTRLNACCSAHRTGLVEEWKIATRGESEAWGQSVARSKERLEHELCKYIAKFLDFEEQVLTTEQMAEFLLASWNTKYLRMSYFNIRVEKESTLEPCPDCGFCNWRFDHAEKIDLDPPAP